MIPESIVLARLAKERNYWQRSNMRTEYVLGVVQGLLIASKMITDLWLETKEHFRRNPNYIKYCFSNIPNAIKIGGRYGKSKKRLHVG